MASFARLLSEQVRNYRGRNASVIRQAPAFYRLLVRMLDEEGLPSNLRPIVEHAIDYFEDPSDAVPEDLYGAYGLSDDVYSRSVCRGHCPKRNKIAGTLAKELGSKVSSHVVHTNGAKP